MSDERLKELDLVKTGNGYDRDLQATSAYYSYKTMQETTQGLTEIKKTLIKLDKQNGKLQAFSILLSIASIPSLGLLIKFIYNFIKGLLWKM